MPNVEEVRQALATVRYPGFSRDIVSFGLVKDIKIEGGDITVEISVATRDPKIPQLVHEQAQEALKALPGVGKVQLNFMVSNLNQVIRQVADSQKDVAQSRGLLIKTELDEHLPSLAFDSDRMVQVMNNLIGNAIKFTKQGAITLRTEHKPLENH